MIVPQLILRQLYTNGSLKNVDSSVQFSLKNRLADTKLLSINEISLFLLYSKYILKGLETRIKNWKKL